MSAGGRKQPTDELTGILKSIADQLRELRSEQADIRSQQGELSRMLERLAASEGREKDNVTSLILEVKDGVSSFTQRFDDIDEGIGELSRENSEIGEHIGSILELQNQTGEVLDQIVLTLDDELPARVAEALLDELSGQHPSPPPPTRRRG